MGLCRVCQRVVMTPSSRLLRRTSRSGEQHSPRNSNSSSARGFIDESSSIPHSSSLNRPDSQKSSGVPRKRWPASRGYIHWWYTTASGSPGVGRHRPPKTQPHPTAPRARQTAPPARQTRPGAPAARRRRRRLLTCRTRCKSRTARALPAARGWSRAPRRARGSRARRDTAARSATGGCQIDGVRYIRRDGQCRLVVRLSDVKDGLCSERRLRRSGGMQVPTSQLLLFRGGQRVAAR